MKPQLKWSWFGVLMLGWICSTVTAHPGDNGFWLIEINGDEITSRVLLPDHLLIHLMELDGTEGRDWNPENLDESKDELLLIIREHLRLTGEQSLSLSSSSEFHREPGGFLEFVDRYTRVPGMWKLTAASSLQGPLGEQVTILCRVVGGKPESFILDGPEAAIDVTLPLSRISPGSEGLPSRDFRTIAFCGLLFLVVLTSAIFVLRTARQWW